MNPTDIIMLCIVFGPLVLMTVFEMWRTAYRRGFRQGALEVEEFMLACDEADEDKACGRTCWLSSPRVRKIPVQVPLSNMCVSSDGAIVLLESNGRTATVFLN